MKAAVGSTEQLSPERAPVIPFQGYDELFWGFSSVDVRRLSSIVSGLRTVRSTL